MSGLSFRPHDGGGDGLAWQTRIGIEGADYPCFAFFNAGEEYVLLFSPTRSTSSLASMDAPRLRAFIEASSSVDLAKVHFIAADAATGLLGASSYCSAEAITGHKVYKRAVACATLCARLAEILKPRVNDDQLPKNDPVQVLRLVGERCAELRTAKGLSEADAARHLDMNVDRLRAIEAGEERGLDLLTMVRLGGFYGFDPSYFFERPA